MICPGDIVQTSNRDYSKPIESIVGLLFIQVTFYLCFGVALFTLLHESMGSTNFF
jgi:hypothetical protein